MDGILMVARLVLAGVFAVAGAAKLADLAGSRRAATDFGVPRWLVPAVAVGLPLVEIAIAAALVPISTARAAAISALGLLTVFAAVVGAALRRGRAPECNCFGQLHSRPVGTSTLARNFALAAVAVLIVAARPGERISSIPLTAALAAAGGLALALVVALQLKLLFGLLRQNGRLLARLEVLEAKVGMPGGGPELGGFAPELSLAAADGELVTIGGPGASEQPTLLVFTDPGCGPCNALLPEIPMWEERALSVAVIAGGTEAEARAKRAEHGIETLLVDPERRAFAAFAIDGTPSAVLIDADGRIAAPPARGAAAVRVLTDRAAAGIAARAAGPNPWALSVGDRLPPLSLTDAAGEVVDLGTAAVKKRALLFFDPQCPHCQRVLAELQQFPPDPELTVVVTRRTAPPELLELGPEVLFDPNAQAMVTAGLQATPSLLSLDERSTITSEPVVGAPAVLAALTPARDEVAR